MKHIGTRQCRSDMNTPFTMGDATKSGNQGIPLVHLILVMVTLTFTHETRINPIGMVARNTNLKFHQNPIRNTSSRAMT